MDRDLKTELTVIQNQLGELRIVLQHQLSVLNRMAIALETMTKAPPPR